MKWHSCSHRASGRNPAPMLPLIATVLSVGVAGAGGFACASGTPVATAASGAAISAAPSIHFTALSHDFGRIRQGDVVRHDFEFTNMGRAVLLVPAVKPACGCTTAGKWDQQVAPGAKGVITLEFNSAGFSGPTTKTATVSCNDPRQPLIELELRSTVTKSFDVTPALMVFNVSDETTVSETKVVRILSHLQEPVSLSGVVGDTPSFHAEVHAVNPGREFELRITAIPPFAARVAPATFLVTTTSVETPTIRVVAHAVVQPPIVTLPTRIALPVGPLPTKLNTTVTIRHSGAAALALTDATVSIPGVEIRRDDVPGNKQIRFTLQFPVGFTLKEGEAAEFSVHSSHPKFPVIRVPVVPMVPRGSLPAASSARVAPITLVPAGPPVQAGVEK